MYPTRSDYNFKSMGYMRGQAHLILEGPILDEHLCESKTCIATLLVTNLSDKRHRFDKEEYSIVYTSSARLLYDGKLANELTTTLEKDAFRYFKAVLPNWYTSLQILLDADIMTGLQILVSTTGLPVGNDYQWRFSPQ